MPQAMSYGLVLHDCPSTTFPSGRVTLMGVGSLAGGGEEEKGNMRYRTGPGVEDGNYQRS